MAETAGDLDLTEETLGAEGIGDFGTEQLERHPALVPDIVRQVDLAHSAHAEQRVYLIMPERMTFLQHSKLKMLPLPPHRHCGVPRRPDGAT